MTRQSVRVKQTTALLALSMAGLDLDKDYHQLPASKVNRVLMVANAYGYRKPKNASGSKGRMFWQFMQRVARR